MSGGELPKTAEHRTIRIQEGMGLRVDPGAPLVGCFWHLTTVKYSYSNEFPI